MRNYATSTATFSKPMSQTQETATTPAQYEETDRAAYDSQQEVADAWAGMRWPAHNQAISHPAQNAVELYSSENFRGYQYPNGTGVLMHYTTREAVRTKTGLILGNQQCWSQGFAHCSKPSDTDYTVPFDAVESAVDNDYDVMEITDVAEGDHPNNSHLSIRIAIFRGGTAGVAYGRDPTSVADETHFAMRLSAEEVDRYKDRVGHVTELLTPKTVRESDMEVVGSDEYVKTRLDADERKAHVENGGNLVESRSRWRDERVNPCQYRADLRGNVVVRQGEWFFIPRPDASPKEVGEEYARDQLGSHKVRRSDGARSPLPTECGECGATSFDVSQGGWPHCAECGTAHGRPFFVRGQIVHTEGDHNAINLGDTWHEAVTHGRDVLMYDTNPAETQGRRWD